MIPDFGSWYRAVQIEPNDERLRRRWNSIEKAADACDLESALELARLFNGFPARHESWLADFKKVFQDEDSAFDATSASAELVVLAGATIAQVLATDKGMADCAAMASQIAAFGQSPARDRIPAISKTLERHIIDRGVAARAAPVRRAHSKEQIKRIEAVGAALQSGHQAAAEPLKAILTDIATQIDETDQKLATSERIRQESAGVLWWLMGGYSETLQAPFASATAGALPLVCGFELAQLTKMTPALPNCRAFLLAAMGSRPPPTHNIVDWIRHVERPVREKIVEAGALPDELPLLPILDCLRRSLEFVDDEVWMSDTFRRGTAAVCTAIDCAEQVHRELVLCFLINSGV